MTDIHSKKQVMIHVVLHVKIKNKEDKDIGGTRWNSHKVFPPDIKLLYHVPK